MIFLMSASLYEVFLVWWGFVWELSCFKASTGLFWPQQITEELRLERNLRIIQLLCHGLVLPQPQVVQTNFCSQAPTKRWCLFTGII